jgi:hypothetical protein
LSGTRMMRRGGFCGVEYGLLFVRLRFESFDLIER